VAVIQSLSCSAFDRLCARGIDSRAARRTYRSHRHTAPGVTWL
jgi:hypothetical protein